MSEVTQIQSTNSAAPGIRAIYEDKPSSYFANARHDIVAMLQTGPQSAVLELGCGAGGTGRAVLAAGKAGRYVGLELSETAGAEAAKHLTEVILGDVEGVDLRPLHGAFDALIISEVLEHLTDPWKTLRRLSDCLKPGGVVIASSPNVAHWSVIKGLISGRFAYTDSGMMDRTHLRWFTPQSYRELFEAAGLTVESVQPLTPLRPKAQLFDRLTGGRWRHLLFTQTLVVARR